MKTARIILIFLVLAMPAMAAEKMPPVQARRTADTAELRLFLNSFASLAEGHIDMVLHSLKVVSSTDEARSGQWEKMKGVLAEFKTDRIKASAVWFMLPDGSYYIAGRGLTDQNLSDRPYYPRLMAGGEITGDLVISRSTGKRSAVVAVPIKRDGKIIGALGTSLDLEEISRMLDKEMGLPETMFFYALDQRGQTSLHRTSALLLAYPSDMGSRSLTKTVGEMLARPEGMVTYDFYGERTVVYRKSPLTGWVFAIGIVTGRPGPGAELPPVLSELGKGVTAELDKVDQDVAKLAVKLSEKDFKAAETRKILGDLCRSYPYAVDCAIVDRDGKMVVVEPREYGKFEGADISAQEQVVRLRESKKPVLSNVFRSVEGYDAVDLEHPVFSHKGELAGSVSMLIRPESLFSFILTPVLQGMPVESFAMQKDGRILYDADTEEIGRMLFEDPSYRPFPQLIAVGAMISREKAGAGSYDYRQEGSAKLVKKDAHWTTVGLHGTEWRLVVMHVRAGRALSPGEDSAKRGTASHDDALRTLAKSHEMKKAMSANDSTGVREMFIDFYAKHEGLYSVQWIDSQGMNRYGYPEENSLSNLDMKTAKTASSKPMLQALSDKKESTFVSPLMEGKTGAFFMVPVYAGEEYLGMIYSIRIKE